MVVITKDFPLFFYHIAIFSCTTHEPLCYIVDHYHVKMSRNGLHVGSSGTINGSTLYIIMDGAHLTCWLWITIMIFNDIIKLTYGQIHSLLWIKAKKR